MYSGEYDVCDVTLSVYLHTGQARKICLGHGGNRIVNVRFPRTVARHIFQACPLWIYTQSNITNISPIKNVSQNKIFSPLCLIKAVHNHITKEKAINHELVVAST